MEQQTLMATFLIGMDLPSQLWPTCFLKQQNLIATFLIGMYLPWKIWNVLLLVVREGWGNRHFRVLDLMKTHIMWTACLMEHLNLISKCAVQGEDMFDGSLC